MHTQIYIYAYIHYTWLACKTDISEEMRNHRSDVISRLFVVPRPHTLYFPTTHSIAFMLRAIIKTVTNCAALNWCRAPKRFSLWLSENCCLSQRMPESIDPKAQITYIGSKIYGPSGPRPRFFIVGLIIFNVVLAIIPWLVVFSPGYSFFLTTGSCVSEPPTRVFLCVRNRDTLNLFLEWGNPLKKWPHFKQKIGHHLPYINYLYEGLHHSGIKNIW